MSADNGIYIAKFLDGYKVIEASAIDNLDFYPKGSEENRKEWQSYFGKAKTFKTEAEAVHYAYELYRECDICEYGIVNLGEGVEFDPFNEAIKKGLELQRKEL